VGCPEGDPARKHAAKTWVDGWTDREPDGVYYMSEKPFAVPSTGVVEYQRFITDPGFAEDRWIQAAEILPGNRAVVHHVAVWVLPPGVEPSDACPQFGYAPGTMPVTFPKGTALYAPAGSRLMFEVHYTPNGTPQTDRSLIGLTFAKPDQVVHRIVVDRVFNVDIEIPPGDPNYRSEAEYHLTHDADLVAFFPHMHWRGKSFRYFAEFPDGTREVLLDVPHWDFHWQFWYQLAAPKRLPAGTRVHCTAVYDNSAANPFNPDSRKRVRWGDQSWDEMMVGYIVLVDTEEKSTPSADTSMPLGVQVHR